MDSEGFWDQSLAKTAQVAERRIQAALPALRASIPNADAGIVIVAFFATVQSEFPMQKSMQMSVQKPAQNCAVANCTITIKLFGYTSKIFNRKLFQLHIQNAPFT